MHHPVRLNIPPTVDPDDAEAVLADIETLHDDPQQFSLERLQAKLAKSLANDLASWDPTVEPVFDVE
jgi:hypothetical protein